MTDLPDINVWLSLVCEGHLHHERARAWFRESRSKRVVFCRITQMGLLRLLTQPKVMKEATLTPRKAWAAYELLLKQPGVGFAFEPQGIEAHWRKYTSTSRKQHTFWTDAYLAAFARAEKLRLVSFDRGFAKYDQLRQLILG